MLSNLFLYKKDLDETKGTKDYPLALIAYSSLNFLVWWYIIIPVLFVLLVVGVVCWIGLTDLFTGNLTGPAFLAIACLAGILRGLFKKPS